MRAPPPPADGRFVRVRQREPGGKSVRELLEQLQALGYLGATQLSATNAIITVAENGAYPGTNFYLSGHAPEAFLIDMDGTELHRWSLDYRELWPDAPEPAGQDSYWRRAHLFENGDIIAFYANRVKGIIKIDKDSKVIWDNYQVQTHHDLDVVENGDIYVLTRAAHVISRIDRSAPVLEDFITILDENGNRKRSISLLDAMERSPYRSLWLDRRNECQGDFEDPDCADLFHTNSLQILDGRLAGEIPAFEKGNILVSLRHLNAIAVVDPDRNQVVWLQTGAYREQHDPRVIASGNILLFDNSGHGRASAIQEIDPRTGDVVWEYLGTKDNPFYSLWCGTAQSLPNGNTLITESESGRVFEVTPRKEIVWEFYNPNRAGEQNEYIGVVFEMIRLPQDFPLDWARRQPSRPVASRDTERPAPVRQGSSFLDLLTTNRDHLLGLNHQGVVVRHFAQSILSCQSPG